MPWYVHQTTKSAATAEMQNLHSDIQLRTETTANSSLEISVPVPSSKTSQIKFGNKLSHYEPRSL